MDFSFSEEVKMLVKTVKDFRVKELVPLEQEFLERGKLTLEQREALEFQAKDNGFWALDVPEQYGGAGLGQVAMCAITEELNKSPMMFKFGGYIEPALYNCNEEQKKKYFYPIIEGQKRTAYAFTDPDAGSDLAGVKTKAVKKGDKWIINGRKIFISHVDRADFIMVFASTDREKGAKGITCFLVDKDAPGFHVVRSIPTMGDDWDPHELLFEDCEVSEENVLGEVNKGFIVADDQLTHGRLEIAAINLGVAARCLEIALEWAKRRKTFGEVIGNRQGIQWMLADSEVELEAARLLVYRAAWMADNDMKIRNEAFIAKLYATEMAQRVTDRALQILGGMGYAKEMPIQSFYRQVRLWRIGHGTSEIHRWMIARNMLKE